MPTLQQPMSDKNRAIDIKVSKFEGLYGQRPNVEQLQSKSLMQIAPGLKLKNALLVEPQLLLVAFNSMSVAVSTVTKQAEI